MDRGLTRDQIANLRGETVYDRAGEKIGDIKEILYDKDTGQPEWLGLSTGFLGTKTALVPFTGASQERDGLRVPYTKDQVKDAPDVDTGSGEISETDERGLYQHYGLSYSDRRSASTLPDSGRPTGTAGMRTRETGPETGERIELREEELRAQKRSVEAGEVGIRKEVVTEQQSMEVPVTREEVYVERRPVEGREVSDRPIGEGENIRVPVREEQVTVEKQPVVREEIDIGKRQVQDTEQVSGTVRREEVRIEGEGDVDVSGRDMGRDRPTRENR